MSEQRTPDLPGGWLPPRATEPVRAPEPPAPEEARPEPEQRKPWWKRSGGLIALVVVAAVKWGAKLKALLLLLPKLKVLTTSALDARLDRRLQPDLGLEVRASASWCCCSSTRWATSSSCGARASSASAPVFIPFLGAAVWAKSLGGNALAEARVGLAGPILGTLGAALCIPLAVMSGDDFWKALAFTGFFLNLFNLLPVVPLDGGRAMAAMAPWMWFAGLFGIVVLAFTFPNPIILLIALLAGFET